MIPIIKPLEAITLEIRQASTVEQLLSADKSMDFFKSVFQADKYLVHCLKLLTEEMICQRQMLRLKRFYNEVN